MCNGVTLNVDLKGITDKMTTFQYTLNDAYFEAIGASDITNGNVICDLVVRKAETFFELNFYIEGTVQVQCDRCLDVMNQYIHTDNQLIVKLGEEYSEDDDFITIVEDDGVLDVSWFIYEFIALSIPVQHVHDADECNAEMMRLLNEHSLIGKEAEEEVIVDPRWSKLSGLFDEK